MLSIDVLNNKPTITVNNREIVDFTAPSIDITQGSVYFRQIVYCPYEFEMRPDLLASFFMGSQDDLGILLKVNGISNPFSLSMGDVIAVPSKTSTDPLLKTPQNDTSETDRSQFRKKLKDRIAKISPERQNYLESRNISTAVSGGTSTSSPLPPNIAGESDQQFVVKDGKLIFGSSIGQCRTNLSENKSKATIKARIAQRNIFNT